MFCALICTLLAVGSLQAPAAQKPAGEPLAFFVGRWQGIGEGEPGRGTSERTYEYVLNGRFLLAKNRSVYPAQEKNPKGETHEDIGYFSFDRQRKRLVLRQFHVEGFVNEYVETPVETPLEAPPGSRTAPTLVFESESIENIPAGWRARESYVLDGENAFTETFELAEPGKGFTVYMRTRFTRQK